MNGFVRRAFDLPERCLTPRDTFLDQRRLRREFLSETGRRLLGGLACAGLAGCGPGKDDPATALQVSEAGRTQPLLDGYSRRFPAQRNAAFEYGRAETPASDAARFTNFYEFGTSKSTYRFVDDFEPQPWTLEVGGLCRSPRSFDLDDLYALAPLEERAYRHRCVETWAMCVPWTGYPLHHLLAAVDPTPAARFVLFETFMNSQVAANQRDRSYPWPYTEGLTIAEARNELALLTLGVYGEPLLKQHGAPVRLVTPWKYGFKSAKSLVKITLTDEQPATFWNTVLPQEYAFEANVEPDVPHPRWSQRREYMLGSRERFDTVKFNGYGDYVAQLYAA